MAMGALLGLMLAGNLAHAQTAAKLKNVDNVVFKEEMKQKDVVIIDMRTPGEVRSGYIPGAINIDVYDPKFKEKIGKLDKNKKYLIYCRSGARSTNGGNQMIQLGFTEVINLKRGMMGWDGPIKK
jgi:rhodanese-related sulfurtransferase